MSRRTLDTDQVVDSAAALADSEGLDAVTLTRVAVLLGVRQPALYRHIDSYDALIRALGLRGREILASRLGEAAVGLAILLSLYRNRVTVDMERFNLLRW